MAHDIIEKTRRSDVLPASLPPRGLHRVEAAAYVGVSPAFFDQMVKDKLMPRPKRVGGRTIWDRISLDKYFASLPGDDDTADDRWEPAV